MPPLDSAAIDRLFACCRQKPGAVETIASGQAQPAFQLLDEDRNTFAQVFLAEKPAVLLVRCPEDWLEALKSMFPGSIDETARTDWTASGWRWATIVLNGAMSEDTLQHAIEASYNLVYRDLDRQKKDLIAPDTRPVSLPEIFDSLIDVHQLQHRAEEIRRWVQPSIALRLTAADEASMPLGRSKMGGLPDLPAGWPWPVFEGKPLAFLGQLNLAEIPQEVRLEPLPASGIMYLFSVFGWQLHDGDIHPDLMQLFNVFRYNDPALSRVLYAPAGETRFERRPRPESIRTFNTAAVDYLYKPSFPEMYDDDLRSPEFRDVDWPDDELDRYSDFVFDLENAWQDAGGFAPDFQLLGYMMPIQAAFPDPDLRPLFQVGSDYELTGMGWADGGIIYFMVSRDDLEKGDYSRISSDMQSG